MNTAPTGPKQIRALIGNIPDPEELYGRDDFIEHLWKVIEGNNVLLLAPRRFGKSGILRHVLKRPHAGFLPLSFELEDVDSSEEFVWRITRELLVHDGVRRLLSNARKLPASLMGWVKDTFDEAEFEGAKVRFKEQIREDWREAAKRMLAELEKADETLLFLFDEMPRMIERISEKRGDESAREFLDWFRTVRLEQKDVLRRHRFIVAGSVGVDLVLHRLGAVAAFTDFARLPVEPLDNAPAGQLAEDLAASFGITWTPELSARLFALIGSPVPYFIHIFFSQLGQLPKASRAALTLDNLDQVYATRVLGPTCRRYFGHYGSRLTRYGKMGEKSAYAILQAVASRNQVSRPALYEIYRKTRGRNADEHEFDELLADLEYDWYLRLDPGTNEFFFRLKVIQDWWKRWYPTSAAAAKSARTKQP